ncbi:MAG: DUF4279 domain-containing protein [Chlorobi bacterium]|nr:DUF4279 domain-containing protein [Chlorobiota bacterium]MBX7215502.1 DUF4279 domain-containing protein [Candidatus Kapabacteria bacterium]
MEHNIRLMIRITGENLNHEDITSLLNICPTKVWHKGDLVTNRTGHRNKEDGWELRVDKVGDSFDELLNIIIKQLEPVADKVKEIAQQFFIELQCVVFLYDDCENSIPSVHMENWQLKFLSEIGAEIDIDIIWSA